MDEKWEYCKFTSVKGARLIKGSTYNYPQIVFFTSEGEKIENLFGGNQASEAMTVAKKLAELGEAGWEMVGAVSPSGIGEYHLYFKRRRS